MTAIPRKSWLRRSIAERPCCQQVRHTDIRTDCAFAPPQVRLPPQTLQNDAEANRQFGPPVGGIDLGMQ